MLIKVRSNNNKEVVVRKSMVVMLALFLATSNAWALLNDDHSVNQGVNVGVGVVQNTETKAYGGDGGDAKAYGGDADAKAYGGDADAKSYSDADSKAYSDSDAKSYAGSKAGSKSSTGDVSLKHSSKDTTYANAWPATQGVVGAETVNAYSIFGGVGLSNTAEYQVCISKLSAIKSMQDSGWITTEQAKEEADKAFEQMKNATRPKRWCGIGGTTTGRNLFNGLGLLSWDSMKKEATD